MLQYAVMHAMRGYALEKYVKTCVKEYNNSLLFITFTMRSNNF